MRNIRRTASRTKLAAALLGIALVGGACADGDTVSPGQEAPAEDPVAPAEDDDATTTGGDTGTTTY